MTDLRFNRYLLSPEQASELTAECLDHIDDVKSGLGVVELDGADEVSNIARALERDVFDRAFGDKTPHTPEFMTHEYGPYEDQSTFFLVLDVEEALPLGAMRVIKGLPNKTTVDLAKAGQLDPKILDTRGFTSSLTWDVTSVVVTPLTRAAKARIATISLYRALYVASLALNVKHWTSIIDDTVVKTYEGLGIPFLQIEEVGPLNYLGTDCAMYVAEVDEIRTSMTLRAEHAGSRVASRISAILDGSDSLPELRPRTIILPGDLATESEAQAVSEQI